jgi:hypothetical protein
VKKADKGNQNGFVASFQLRVFPVSSALDDEVVEER